MSYRKIGHAIEVNITDEYVVRANINKINGKSNKKVKSYDVTLELRKKDFGYYDTLDDEHFVINTNSINTDVCKFILDKHSEKFFHRFMERYDFELDCIDKGVEYFDEERKKDNV